MTRSICERFVRFRPAPAAFALAFGLGTVLAPAVVFGQDQEQAQAATAGVTRIELPTSACQNSPKLRPLCGSDVALARSIKMSPGNEDDRVEVFTKSGPYKSFEDPKDHEMRVTVEGEDDPDADYIEVKVRLSKQFLGQFVSNPNDREITFYTVSVVGKTGAASCYWDCYYVNGKKICECIEG